MLINLKAMVVVLGVALAVFIIARPICLRFIAEKDFARRRNIWLVATLGAFITPNFWLYVLMAAPLFVWAGRKDSNPAALYVLLLHVIPPLGLEIPVSGINSLFSLDSYRLLSLTILLPAAWRLARSQTNRRLTLIDGLLLAYGVLYLVHLVPYETATHTLRRGFLYFIDVLLLYFVISRLCTSRGAIVETMVCFTLACAIFAPLAVFEAFKGWLLYEGIGFEWGIPIPFAYLLRLDSLRAQVSAGHAIALGSMLAIAFGFSLYLRTRLQSSAAGIAMALWMWLGLLAAYSRGPWLAAALLFFAYIALGPKGSSRFVKILLISALAGAVVVLSPIGRRLTDNLPFVGTVDVETVDYRHRLLERSWELVQQRPLFGNPHVLLSLEDLRHGQGIIDVVNSYASVAMFHGLVGLVLFLGPFLVGLWRTYKLTRASSDSDAELSALGSNLTACMLATLFILGTTSFYLSIQKIFYVLTALSAGYAQLRRSEGPAWVERGVLHA